MLKNYFHLLYKYNDIFSRIGRYLPFIITFDAFFTIPSLLAHVGSASVDREGGMASGNRNRRQRLFQLQKRKKGKVKVLLTYLPSLQSANRMMLDCNG